MSCIEGRGTLIDIEANVFPNGNSLKKCERQVAPPLELLAEVASAQLSCVQGVHSKSNQSGLTLSEICSLSNNQLVKLFAMLNDLTLEYKCVLLPDRCSQIRSERKAMGAHLREHLKDLGIENEEFTWIPLHQNQAEIQVEENSDSSISSIEELTEADDEEKSNEGPDSDSFIEEESGSFWDKLGVMDDSTGIYENEVSSQQPKSVLIGYESLGLSPTLKIDATAQSTIHDHDYLGDGVKQGSEENMLGDVNAEAVETAAAILTDLHNQSRNQCTTRPIIQQLQEWEARSQLTGICRMLMTYVPIPVVGSEIETVTMKYQAVQDKSNEVQSNVVESCAETSPVTDKTVICSKAEKEKALALKYLEDAHSLKSSSPQTVLECRICEPRKPFTAYSSLINHYRSHAGIKLFECKDCGKGFTRQHSLNYHTLTHSGATRFTCKECGSKFRHPFHFKEHKRRHTGEYPYQCMDCLVRFKTRNTYKRHLKSRHNKILAPDGTILNTLGETCGTIPAPLKPQEMLAPSTYQPIRSKDTINLTTATPVLLPRTETITVPLFQQVYACVNQPTSTEQKSCTNNPSTHRPKKANPLRTGEQVDYKKMNEFMANNSMFNKMFISNRNVMTMYTQPEQSSTLTYVTVRSDPVIPVSPVYMLKQPLSSR